MSSRRTPKEQRTSVKSVRPSGKRHVVVQPEPVLATAIPTYDDAPPVVTTVTAGEHEMAIDMTNDADTTSSTATSSAVANSTSQANGTAPAAPIAATAVTAERKIPDATAVVSTTTAATALAVGAIDCASSIGPAAGRQVNAHIFTYDCHGKPLNPGLCIASAQTERTDQEAIELYDAATDGNPEPNDIVKELYEMLHKDKLPSSLHETVKEGGPIEPTRLYKKQDRAIRNRIARCLRAVYRRPDTTPHYCRGCEKRFTNADGTSCDAAAVMSIGYARPEFLVKASIINRFPDEVATYVTEIVARFVRTHFIPMVAKMKPVDVDVPIGEETTTTTATATAAEAASPTAGATHGAAPSMVNGHTFGVTPGVLSTPGNAPGNTPGGTQGTLGPQSSLTPADLACFTIPPTPPVSTAAQSSVTPASVSHLNDAYTFRMPPVSDQRGYIITNYATFVYLYKQMPWFISACNKENSMTNFLDVSHYEALNRCHESNRTGVVYDHFYDAWPGFVGHTRSLFEFYRVARDNPDLVNSDELKRADISVRNSEIRLLRYTNDQLLVVFSSPFESALFSCASWFHWRNIGGLSPDTRAAFCYYESSCTHISTVFCAKCKYPRLVEARVGAYSYYAGSCLNCTARAINLARLGSGVQDDPDFDIDCVTAKNTRVVDPVPAVTPQLHCTLRMADKYALLPFARDAKSLEMPRMLGVYDTSATGKPTPRNIADPPAGYKLQVWLVPIETEDAAVHPSQRPVSYQPPSQPPIPFAPAPTATRIEDNGTTGMSSGFRPPSQTSSMPPPRESPPTPARPRAARPVHYVAPVRLVDHAGPAKTTQSRVTRSMDSSGPASSKRVTAARSKRSTPSKRVTAARSKRSTPSKRPTSASGEATESDESEVDINDFY